MFFLKLPFIIEQQFFSKTGEKGTLTTLKEDERGEGQLSRAKIFQFLLFHIRGSGILILGFIRHISCNLIMKRWLHFIYASLREEKIWFKMRLASKYEFNFRMGLDRSQLDSMLDSVWNNLFWFQTSRFVFPMSLVPKSPLFFWFIY